MLALADIDNFKMINDAHGHPIGDRVLVGAAQILSGSLPARRLVARYGGEEFAILLAGMKLAGAETRIGDLLKTIAAHRFEYELGSLQFTLSCGMAEFVKGDTADALIARADDALYEAKRKGKKSSGYCEEIRTEVSIHLNPRNRPDCELRPLTPRF